MAGMDPLPLKVLHLDGKVLWNAARARLEEDTVLAQAALTVDTPPDLQKPKAEQALTLVNFQAPEQSLIDQMAVPQDTNEEAAVAAHLPKMDLAGVLIIADAAHTVKANCRQITQMKGGDYLFFLKGNQPVALAKAQQLLPGNLPPLRRSRSIKPMAASRTASFGSHRSMARPSPWPAPPRSFASIAKWTSAAKAGSSRPR
jgi:hypothetical protein